MVWLGLQVLPVGRRGGGAVCGGVGGGGGRGGWVWMSMTNRVEQLVPETVQQYYDKLYKKITELLGDRTVEESRLVTETAVVAEKIAVDEELVRLHSHIAQFRGFLESTEPTGRKMDFLVQEMNREVNTTGSKSQSLEITKLVVDMKSEIEKIREQIQNIE